MKSLCVVVLLVFVLCSTGCGLLGPSVEKAEQVAAARQAELDRASAAYQQASKDLEDVVRAYKDAVASGDKSKMLAAVDAVDKAMSKYESAKEVAASTYQLYQSAVEDFKSAKSTSDYVGTIFGWGIAALGSLFGAGGLLGRARAKEALTGTTAALEKVKGSDNPKAAWSSAKAELLAKLSTGALDLIDKVRPA